MSEWPVVPYARATLLVTALNLASPGVLAADEQNASGELDPMVVSATRTDTPISELSRSVSVIDQRQIRQQASLDSNLGTILSRTVPGFGPSTEAASNFGQTLRGRDFLVLIDGIPQSTPLNDQSRDLNTIAASSIERIEVVRGGTAAYGFGATGGLVNVITRKPSDEPLAGYSQAGASVSTEETDDSEIYETEHRVSGTRGDFDYVLSASLADRNGRFDSEGRRIPPNPLGSQGGLSDTQELSLLAKGGFALGGDQRLEFMVNHLDNEQDSDFTFGSPSTLGADPLPNSRRTPAIPVSEAIAGTAAVRDPTTENTTGSITYTNRDFRGSSIRLNTYFGDRTIVFPRFPGFSQGRSESQKFGSRLTIDTPVSLGGRDATVTWGLDYLGDEVDTERFGSGLTADPLDLDQDAVAAFGQLEVPFGDTGLVRAGVRREAIEVDAATVQSNFSGNTVLGGTVDFDATLFNASGVLYLTDSLELYGGYSQGFSIASLGREIRDAGAFGAGDTFRAEQFESEANEVDNYELGLRTFSGGLQASVTAFYTESDDGTTFTQDLQIQKVEEETYGLEASLDHELGRATRVGGTLTVTEGEKENPDGSSEDLPNTRVQPERLTAYVEHAPTPRWNNRLQLQVVGHRDPETDDFGGGEVDGYELVDLVSSYRLGPGDLQVSISNLFNEDYFPAVNQAFNIPSGFSKGPGRRVGVSYALEW